MPIITEAQSKDDDLETLQVSRNKEDEVYNFVLTELDAAAADLPENRDAANRNRCSQNNCTFALKARAALYAASISQIWSCPIERAGRYTAGKSRILLCRSI